MEEEKDKYEINNFLNENNSSRNNLFNQNNMLQKKSFTNNYNFINNYNNNLTENKSYALYKNINQKRNYCASTKNLDINSSNDDFDENILNINYTQGNYRYDQDINLNYNFSENNILTPKIYKKKMISYNSSNRIGDEYKYSNLNNLNINRIFSSEQKPKGIMNKNEKIIFLKKEKERKNKDEEDIKVLDKEKITSNFRPNHLENVILLKNFNYGIEKLEKIISRKKEMEKEKKEKERNEYERKKMEEYMKRKNEEKRRKRIELERRKIEMERKRIEEERRRKAEIAINRQRLEKEFQKREENEESQFNSGLFNHLTTNHYISNIRSNIINDNHDNHHNRNNNIMIINNINNNNNNDYMDNEPAIFNRNLNERENSREEDLDYLISLVNNSFVGPIKNDLLNVLPESRIADINKLNEENRKCLICLEEYVNNDNAIYLPCFHIFHKNCIIQWIKKHANCPICKININEII